MVKEVDQLKEILALLNLPISDNALALKVYETLKHVREQGHGHGITMVLGYRPELKHHVAPMADDVFDDLHEHINDYHMKEKILNIREIDGAILIDSSGKMLHSGMFFVVNPLHVLKNMGITRTNDLGLPELFGFSRKVGTRHISSISASYKMPDTLIYALSEEDSKVRVFLNGRILFSEVDEEIYRGKVPIEELLEPGVKQKKLPEFKEGESSVKYPFSDSVAGSLQ